MWTCPKCGEKSEDQFDSCWNCADQTELNKPPPPPPLFGRILVVVIKLVLLGVVAGAIVQLILTMPHKPKPAEYLALRRLTWGFEQYAQTNGRPPATWEEVEIARDLPAINKMLQDFRLPAPIQSNYYFVTNGIVTVPYNLQIVLLRSSPVKYHGSAGRFAIVGSPGGSSNNWHFSWRFLPNGEIEKLFRDAHMELQTVTSNK